MFVLLAELMKKDFDICASSVHLLETGMCGLHTVHNAFRSGCSATPWDLETLLSAAYHLLYDSPARREDFSGVSGATQFPLKYSHHSDGCEAVLYCSDVCRQNDWDQGITTPGHPHRYWCSFMQIIMAREKELCDFPFTFAKVTTQRNFHKKKVERFFQSYGICGQGLWKLESSCFLKTGTPWKNSDDAWVLPVESDILSNPPSLSPPSPRSPLLDWIDYYSFRQLSLQSPVSVILTYPLTLYYILTTCFKTDAPDKFNDVLNKGEIIIHILGVEKEAEIKEVFLECAYLLPTLQLFIVMYGNQLNSLAENNVWEKENLHIIVRNQLYHESSTSDPKPHIAVAFNAGLPAYSTWPATVIKLLSEQICTYFTDQSECSCIMASACVKSLEGAEISPAAVNPFRSPVRIVTREQNMPWFSNAFIFRLKHKLECDMNALTEVRATQ